MIRRSTGVLYVAAAVSLALTLSACAQSEPAGPAQTTDSQALEAARLDIVPLSLRSPVAAPQQIVPGQVIVRFADAATEVDAAAQLPSADYRVAKALFPRLDLYLVELTNLTVDQALAELAQVDAVMYAQADHVLTRRAAFPSDTSFSKQWGLHNTGQSVTSGSCAGACGGQASDCYCDSLCVSYGDCCANACSMCGYCGGTGTTPDADIDAPEAWDYGTGQDLSDPPVVAIMEGGCDTDHTDLAANLWWNPGETLNGVDDDGNGYIDDRNGWNVSSNNGSIPQYDSHGSAVAGVVGARGDNNKGVTGVDWGAKLMIVASSSTATSATVASYAYAAAVKEQWLQTNGAKGANVVATNSSFGYDYANCNSGSYPLWNDMYDEMGSLGILSAASTTNNNSNVDVSGDVPTTCSSQWLVAVTATNQEDDRAGTGYGANHIDLGAPGVKIHTTSSGNGYATESGTSFASPMVAGAIALLHSQAPPAFHSWYLEDPAAAALALKEMLLDNVDPIQDLQGKSVSGGRLNVHAAAEEMAAWGGGCVPVCAGVCGDDGCGGSCGTCSGGTACQGGQCVPVGGGALQETYADNQWMATIRILTMIPVGTKYTRIRGRVIKHYKGCEIAVGKNLSLVAHSNAGCPVPAYAVGQSWVMAGSDYPNAVTLDQIDHCGYHTAVADVTDADKATLSAWEAALSCP